MASLDRIINLVAVEDGSVRCNLGKLGYSNSICRNLSKQMGLIEKANDLGEIIPLRVVDLLKKGEKFSLHIKDLNIEPIKPYDLPIEIVYEDEDVAVINKPSSLAVIATHNHYGRSLPNALANIWGDFVYRPVNRLDRDTSGLMIIAKNQLSHSILSESKIIKKYHALVEGRIEGEGVWNFPLDLASKEGMKRVVKSTGKEAITIYKSLKNYDTYSLIELELVTGRTHQIRAHALHVGHPLLCDKLYGKGGEFILENGKVLDRQALHSCYLKFTSPISKKEVELFCKADFE